MTRWSSTARTARAARTALAVPLLLAGVGMAGCGGGESAPDPDGAPEETTDDVEPEVVALVHGTAVGGTTSGVLAPVGTEAELATFLADFDREPFEDDVSAAVAEAREVAGSGVVQAGVIAVGCDVPPGAVVEEAPDAAGGYTVTARKVADPLPNCFAPMTTVAVVITPRS